MTADETVLLTLLTTAAELIENRASDHGPTQAEEVWLNAYNAYMDRDDNEPMPPTPYDN